MFIFILLISGWVVAASLMAENAHVGIAVVVEISHLCVVSGRIELLPPVCVLVCPLLQPSVCLLMS